MLLWLYLFDVAAFVWLCVSVGLCLLTQHHIIQVFALIWVSTMTASVAFWLLIIESHFPDHEEDAVSHLFNISVNRTRLPDVNPFVNVTIIVIM